MLYNYNLIIIDRCSTFSIYYKKPFADMPVRHNNAVGLRTGYNSITPVIGYNSWKGIPLPIVRSSLCFVSFIRWQYKQTFVCVLIIITVGICPQIAEFVNIKVINYTRPLIAIRKSGCLKIIFMYLFIVLDMIYALVKVPT